MGEKNLFFLAGHPAEQLRPHPRPGELGPGAVQRALRRRLQRLLLDGGRRAGMVGQEDPGDQGRGQDVRHRGGGALRQVPLPGGAGREGALQDGQEAVTRGLIPDGGAAKDEGQVEEQIPSKDATFRKKQMHVTHYSKANIA